MDPFIAGIITTCAVLGLAEIIRRINNARAKREDELIGLRNQLVNQEYDIQSCDRKIKHLEEENAKAHKEFRESFETAGDTIRLVHTDVAILTNHLGLVITSPSPCDRRVVIVPQSAKDTQIS